MKFINHYYNGLPTFKLIKHYREMCGVPTRDCWVIVDEDCSLRVLLARYEMLNFTEAELLAAQMLVAKNSMWRKSQSSRSYCREQAGLIAKYADDAIERVASQIIEPCKFTNIEYGLPPWIRRLTLAFALELGIKLE